MAQYVPIPKDLSEIKQKFFAGLTKRQALCFGIGFAIGIPTFFLTRNTLGLSGGIICGGILGAPAIMCGLYQKNGLHLEQVVKNMITFFRNPRKRTYQSENIYQKIENAIEYNRLRTVLRYNSFDLPKSKRKDGKRSAKNKNSKA